jgi:hypothetical protein
MKTSPSPAAGAELRPGDHVCGLHGLGVAFLQKPSHSEELARKVRAVLDEGSIATL